MAWKSLVSIIATSSSQNRRTWRRRITRSRRWLKPSMRNARSRRLRRRENLNPCRKEYCPMPTTPENELRVMVGDLFMQVAMMRAEIANLKERLPPPPEEKPEKGNAKEKPDKEREVRLNG